MACMYEQGPFLQINLYMNTYISEESVRTNTGSDRIGLNYRIGPYFDYYFDFFFFFDFFFLAVIFNTVLVF